MREKMKILYIAGESANWVVRLCNQFCEQGHDVTCVVQQLDEYDKDNPVVEHPNLKRINVDYNTMFNSSSMELILKDIINDFDVIYGSHAPISTVVYYLGTTYKKPWGVMLLDIPTDLMLQDKGRMGNWKYWFAVLKQSDNIIFNTKVARDEYKRYTNIFYNDDNVIMYATEVPKKYQLSGIGIEGDYVVSAFRLTPAKNASIITKALATMDKPLKQVVIGRDRGDLANIMKIAKEHNIEVIYKDMVTEEEKFELIKNSYCLVYPQLSEYIGGLSPWEGMFIGKPTLVSDYKVLRDMFEDNVTYFDPTSPESLASAFNSVYVKSGLIRANEFANEHAVFKTMANKMLKIFETMVKK
jgi:glycosyltransferase involved in cell wall biosynthesis